MHDSSVIDEAIRRLENKSDNKKMSFPLKTEKAIHGLLTSVSEELLDVPLYYTIPDLCKVLSCSSPPMKQFKAAIINSGYRVSGYHKEPNAIKTDAPNNIVWDIMRTWCKSNPPKKHKKTKNKKKTESALDSNEKETEGKEPIISAGEKILSVEPKIKVNFSVPKGLLKRKKAQRFPQNPESNWGPKPRASGYKRKSETDDAITTETSPETKVSRSE